MRGKDSRKARMCGNITLFSMSFLSLLLIHPMCANGWGKRQQKAEKFCHLEMLVSEFIPNTRSGAFFST